MNKYELLKYYWEKGFWNEEMMRNAVVKEWITTFEFKEITGNGY